MLVNGAVVQLTNALFSTAGKGEPEDDAKSAVDQLIPVRVARVAVRGSTLRYADLVGAPELKQWQINELESLIINITPSERAPDTTFTATGTLLNSAKVKAAGKLLLLETPARWDIDAEVRRFDLAKANPLLKNYVPLTFGSGQLDLFTEAKSDHDGLVGYIKPYLTGLDVVGDRGDFVGGKHLIFEMLGATGNLILRRGKENSVATKIEFSKKGQEFKWNIGKAVALALEHGFADKLSANAEDRIELK